MVCNYSNTIAIKHGINAALIAGYINSCIENKETYKDENTPWIRITYKSITAVFPFMSIGTAQYTIQKLKKANIISVKKFRKEHFDRANFYTLTEYGKNVIKGDDEFECRKKDGGNL